MSALATALRVDLELLDDRYIEMPDSDWSDQPPTYPTLYRAEVDGTAWLSDKYWLLPESACIVGSDTFPIEPLPGAANLAKIAEWVQQVLTADVAGPLSRRFAPAFAGCLTRLGVSAIDIGETSGLHALVDAEGNRIGGLMPLRETGRPFPSLPIPCSPEVTALFDRITELGTIRTWQAWDLAAHLGGAL